MNDIMFPSIDNAFEKYEAETFGFKKRALQKSKGMMARSQEAGAERVVKEIQEAGGEKIPLHIYDKSDPMEYARFFADFGVAVLDMAKAPVKGATQAFLGLPGDVVEILNIVGGVMNKSATVQEYSEIGKKFLKMANIDPESANNVIALIDKFPTSEDVKKHFDEVAILRTKYAQPVETFSELLSLGSLFKSKKIAKVVTEKGTEVLKDIKQNIKKTKKAKK